MKFIESSIGNFDCFIPGLHRRAFFMTDMITTGQTYTGKYRLRSDVFKLDNPEFDTPEQAAEFARKWMMQWLLTSAPYVDSVTVEHSPLLHKQYPKG